MKSVIEVYSDIAAENPKWTPDEERAFIKSCVTKTGKWRNKSRFVNEAFKHNLGLVFSIVQKTAFVKTEDVVQKGMIALVESLKKFDPNKGIRISTWVANPIRWAVQQHQHTYSKDKPIADEIASLNQRYNLHMRVVSVDASVKAGDDESETFGNLISEANINPDYANLRGVSESLRCQDRHRHEFQWLCQRPHRQEQHILRERHRPRLFRALRQRRSLRPRRFREQQHHL